MNNYTQTIREHKLKATPQRIEILHTIFNYGHINIDKLYEEMRLKFSSISLATIYKNINAMSENHLLFEVKLPNEKSVYEIIKDEHAHLVCNSCGKIEDVKIDFKNIEKIIANNHQFKINQTDLVLSGKCNDCNSIVE